MVHFLAIDNFVSRIHQNNFIASAALNNRLANPKQAFFVNRLAKNKNKLGFSKPKLILGQLNIQFNVEFV